MLMTRHILLTGGSRGIGAAIAARFASEDARIFVASSKEADLSQPSGADELWSPAFAALDGRIDCLINNAGVFEANPVSAPDADWLSNWARTMQINLTASAQLCRHAVRHWIDNGSQGRIVNIASRAAYRGDSPDHWHYAASKAGMVAMTKSIARGYAALSLFRSALALR